MSVPHVDLGTVVSFDDKWYVIYGWTLANPDCCSTHEDPIAASFMLAPFEGDPNSEKDISEAIQKIHRDRAKDAPQPKFPS
jgi:hypothetical protein